MRLAFTQTSPASLPYPLHGALPLCRRLVLVLCHFDPKADKAISSIKPMHVQEVKKLPNPADVIKLVFDSILLLFHLPVSAFSGMFVVAIDMLLLSHITRGHGPFRSKRC